jgi:hypothetical protein
MAGFGLRIAKSQGMEGFTGNTSNFPIDTATVTPIFVGDPVILSNGAIVDAAGGNPGLLAAAPILGVFAGWEDTGPTAEYGVSEGPYKRHWSAASGASANKPQAKVAMPPHSLFWAKGDATIDWSSAFAPGMRAGIFYAAGSAQFGDSRVTIAPQASGPLQIHRLVDMPGNTIGNTTEPVFECTILLQQGTASDAA